MAPSVRSEPVRSDEGNRFIFLRPLHLKVVHADVRNAAARGASSFASSSDVMRSHPPAQAFTSSDRSVRPSAAHPNSEGAASRPPASASSSAPQALGSTADLVQHGSQPSSRLVDLVLDLLPAGARRVALLPTAWKSTSVSGATKSSGENRHRHAIEQVWRLERAAPSLISASHTSLHLLFSF